MELKIYIVIQNNKTLKLQRKKNCKKLKNINFHENVVLELGTYIYYAIK